MQRWEVRLALALGALGAAALWLRPLTSSLWLDETGTVWLIEGSLTEALERTLTYQGGSPLYYVFAWTARQISTSELALRVPSVIAMGVATYLFFVLGTRLFDRRTGLIAAALFPAFPAVAFAAGDARPYALALLSLISSAVALVAWLESGRLRYGVVYAVSLVATVYLHYLIAVALLAQVVLVVWFGLRNIKIRARQIAVVIGLTLLFAAPLAPNAIHVLGQRSVLSNPNPTSAISILEGMAPPLILAAVMLPLAITALIERRNVKLPRPRSASFLFAIAWFVIPFSVLLALSWFTNTNTVVLRYFLSTAPAICLLLAVAVSSLERVPVRYAATALGVVAGLAFGRTTHTGEDWRAAAAAQRRVADDRTPVILFSGFIEAKQSTWLTHPERASYLEAPAAAYPMYGRVYPGPWDLGPGEQGYLQELLTDELLPADRFVVLTTGGSGATREWLDPRVASEGYRPRLVDSWDDKIFLFVYDRQSS